MCWKGWVQDPLASPSGTGTSFPFEVFLAVELGVQAMGVYSYGTSRIVSGATVVIPCFSPVTTPEPGQAGKQLSIIPAGHDSRVTNRIRIYHFDFILAAVSSHLCKTSSGCRFFWGAALDRL